MSSFACGIIHQGHKLLNLKEEKRSINLCLVALLCDQLLPIQEWRRQDINQVLLHERCFLTSASKLLKCGSCKLKQRITPESKHWFVRLFVKDTTTNNKFYLSVFHQQLVKLFNASQQKMHAALTEDDLTDILLEMHQLNITLNLAHYKLLHVH